MDMFVFDEVDMFFDMGFFEDFKFIIDYLLKECQILFFFVIVFKEIVVIV